MSDKKEPIELRTTNGVVFQLYPCAECKGNVRIKVPVGEEPPDQFQQGGPADFAFPQGSRVSVVKRMYYQQTGKQVIPVEVQFTRPSAVHGQHYTRELVATQEWQDLDFNWVKSAGLVIIINMEGRNLHVQPSKQQMEEFGRKVIEVGVADHPFLEVHASCDESWTPSHSAKYRARCLAGEANFTLTVFPG